MLDYGYRSKCCKAPIRIGNKKITKTNQIVKVWICCECRTKDVQIIPYEEVKDQIKDKNDAHVVLDTG